MADYLYLDIETIPTSDPAVMAEISAGVTPPGNISKPETVAAWHENVKPGLIKEAIAKTSLNGAYGQICCIGWAWNDKDAKTVLMVDGKDEEDLIDLAFDYMHSGRPDHFHRPIIVGHNIANFDIRYMWQRAFIRGLVVPAWFPRDPKPWSQEVHDTMAIWGGARDYISLDTLCRIMGLPDNGGVNGSDIAGLWAKGDIETIGKHCRSDIDRVRGVHKKMLIAMGSE